MTVEIDDGEVTVSADTLATHFDISATMVHDLMRSGRMVGRVEKGADQDQGRYRLTFRYGGRRLRLTCDDEGHIFQIDRTVLVNRKKMPPS